MSFTVIDATEIDAKSPVDDLLMAKIKQDLDDLNTRVVASGSTAMFFELQGKLNYMVNHARNVCGAALTKDFIPTQARWMLKKGPTLGSFYFDLRKHTSPRTPITAINPQYTGTTQAVGQAGATLSTTSVGRATAQIATQSITHAKAANNTQSIIGLGSNLWQYNLASLIDSDTSVGDPISISGSTNALNDGTFSIVEVNRGGYPSVVVSNASGVAQTGAAGAVQVKIMSYNYANPVSAFFAAGSAYTHHFASHTTGANNGDFSVYAINQSGNNIWVKHSTGVAQAGVAGTADTNFWTFAVSVAPLSTDFVVGEAAKTTNHTSGGNNAGVLPIIAINQSGNNIILYNLNGVAQAGAPGNVNSNRWSYTMPSNPSSQITAGDYVYLTGHTSALNDGVYMTKNVNSAAFQVYNVNGVTQGSANGTTSTTRKLVSFSSDQSANYTTDSYIEMQGCASALYNYYWYYAPHKVVQINRGGGSNYNVVIDITDSARASAPVQASPAGYIQTEMKSLFTGGAQAITPDLTGIVANQNTVFSSTALVATTILANTPVMLYLTAWPTTGAMEDLTVSIL